MARRAFGKAPAAYYTGYDGAGVVFVEGTGNAQAVVDYPEISKELESHESNAPMSTDHWPFLYLESKTIPVPVIGVFILFLTFSLGMLRRQIPISRLANPQSIHLFFLGAGPGTAEAAADILRARHPTLQIVGTESPPFRPLTADELATYVRQVQAARTNVLILSFAMPNTSAAL